LYFVVDRVGASFSKSLPSVTFAEEKVLIFLILRQVIYDI